MWSVKHFSIILPYTIDNYRRLVDNSRDYKKNHVIFFYHQCFGKGAGFRNKYGIYIFEQFKLL